MEGKADGSLAGGQEAGAHARVNRLRGGLRLAEGCRRPRLCITA